MEADILGAETDRAARLLAAQGDSTDLRWSLIVLLAPHKIGESVARRSKVRAEEAVDVARSLDELIEAKLLDPSFCDVGRFESGASLLGWARNLARAALATQLRTLRTRAAHTTELPENTGRFAVSDTPLCDLITAMSVEDMADDAMSVIARRPLPVATSTIPHAAADAIHLAYRIDFFDRRPTPVERVFIAAAAGDESVVARAWQELVDEDAPSDGWASMARAIFDYRCAKIAEATPEAHRILLASLGALTVPLTRTERSWLRVAMHDHFTATQAEIDRLISAWVAAYVEIGPDGEPVDETTLAESRARFDGFGVSWSTMARLTADARVVVRRRAAA